MIVKPTGSAMVHGFRAQVSDSGFRLRGDSFGNHDPNIQTPRLSYVHDGPAFLCCRATFFRLDKTKLRKPGTRNVYDAELSGGRA